MAQTSAHYAGTVVNDASNGETAWQNPSFAQGSGETTVALVPSGKTTSQRLKATNYGFVAGEFPAGAEITGIGIRLRVRGGTNNRAYSREVFIVKGGTTQTGATNLGEGEGSKYTATLTNREYGGDGQLFGLSWAVSDITAEGFGVSLACGRSNTTTIECDWMEIVVFYSVPEPIEKTLTAAAETDTLVALSAVKPIKKTLTAAAEANAALTVTHEQPEPPQEVELGPVSETDAATGLGFVKPIHKALTVASEESAATSLSFAKPIHKSVGAAAEADEAVGLSGARRVSLLPVAEVDVGLALGISQPIHAAVGAAAEVDAAVPLAFAKPIRRTLSVAMETAAALPLDITVSENLLLNPGFESGISPWVGSSATVTETEEEVHGGAKAAKVETKNLLAVEGVSQGIEKEWWEAGETFHFAAWVKASAGTALRLRVLSGLQAFTLNFTASGDWERRVISFAVPYQTSSVSFTVGTNGKQSVTFYVDDAELGIEWETALSPAAEADAAVGLSITHPIHRDLLVASEADLALAVSFSQGEGQLLRPDEDLEATGWTEAPLWPKLSDSSDATTVKASLS